MVKTFPPILTYGTIEMRAFLITRTIFFPSAFRFLTGDAHIYLAILLICVDIYCVCFHFYRRMLVFHFSTVSYHFVAACEMAFSV